MMKYRLTEKIGSGGMAEVFRAVGEGPEGFERPFVIKRIHPRLSEAPEFVRMFVDEAKISARLVHPNIVQVFEFAPQDGGYYIVMEPVDGFDMGWLLRRRLESRREVPPPAFVAEVGRQACRGLDFAHTLTDADGQPLGIVHRDVTPPNIMVTWNGTVKIVDFGIARAVEALRTSMTDAGMVKGKMSYVAPELLDGKTADARSDVFSLGVVLHELLSGRQLFAGDNDLETLRLVREMVIPPPSARNPGVKRGLDAIVMRALERDPVKRYQSAGDMGDDLETVVLRERYSTRALARKARELAEREDPSQSADRVVQSAVPVTGEDIVQFVDSASVTASSPGSSPSGSAAVPSALARTESGPIGSGANRRPPATPPRIPAHVTATSKNPTNPTNTTNATNATNAAAPWRWTGVAVAASAVLGVVFLGLILRRPIAAALAAGNAPVVAAPSPTVRVALDSTPQGATVIAAGPAVAAGAGGAASADGATQTGRPLGETPLLIDLPRGNAPVELMLTKSGYAPLVFKIIPHQEKEVLAHLEHLPPPPPPVAVEPVAPLTRRHGAGSSARRTPLGISTLRAAGAVPGSARMGAATAAAPARAMATNQPRAAAPASIPAPAPAARPAAPPAPPRR